MTIKYSNVSNPAAFGAEWVNGESGNRFQLVNLRGTTDLMFGMKSASSSAWSTTRVIGPERFGLTDPPKSFKDFMKIVRAYVED